MFHFSAFASIHYVFMYWYLPYGKWVSPFRHLRITGYLPPPRSFSQAITSFFASDCQGIHHMHLITWLYNPKQSFILTSRISNRVRLATYSYSWRFVDLTTVQLQLDSYTKTLDSVNFARTHFIQLSQLLARLFKTSLNKLFQLKYILLMILPAFVRSGNCDKSQKLIKCKPMSTSY